MRCSKFLKGLLVAVLFLSVPVWGHATLISQSSIRITALSITIDGQPTAYIQANNETNTYVSDATAAGAFASAKPSDISSNVEIYDSLDPALGVVASAGSFMSYLMPIVIEADNSVAVTFSFSYEAIFNVSDPADGSFYAELAIYAHDAGADDDPLYFLPVSEEDGDSGTVSETYLLAANDLNNGTSVYSIEVSTAAKITVPADPVAEPTPEPATLLLLGAGLGGLVLIRRRKQQFIK